IQVWLETIQALVKKHLLLSSYSLPLCGLTLLLLFSLSLSLCFCCSAFAVIPAVSIRLEDGNDIKAQLLANRNVNITLNASFLESSPLYRSPQGLSRLQSRFSPFFFFYFFKNLFSFFCT